MIRGYIIVVILAAISFIALLFSTQEKMAEVDREIASRPPDIVTTDGKECWVIRMYNTDYDSKLVCR